MPRAILLAVVSSWMLAAVPAATQGAGTVGAHGLEPQLGFWSNPGCVTASIDVSNVTPATTLDLHYSTGLAHIDLGPAGFAPGFAGLQMSPTAGVAGILGPFVASATDHTISWTFDPSLLGVTLYFQAYVWDAGAPGGGLALSDTVPGTLGCATDRVLIATEAGPGLVNFESVNGDLTMPGPCSSELHVGSINSLVLTNGLPDLDPATPTLVTPDHGRPYVSLGQHTRLYRYESPNNQKGFFMVHHGAMVHLASATMEFEEEVAASASEPLVAVLASDPIPERGGASLGLLRVDGENHAGLAERIWFPAGQTGLEIDEESMTFLSQSLLFVANDRLYRLPTSGQATPELIDLTLPGHCLANSLCTFITTAANGESAAIIVGDHEHGRIFLVGNSGPARCLTPDPAELVWPDEETFSVALSPDGQTIAYLLVAGNPEHQELFVRSTIPGTTGSFHLSSPGYFEPYIDIETPILFASNTGLVFPAGVDSSQVDIYTADLAALGQSEPTFVNVTGTSGTMTTPFQPGANLTVRSTARAVGGDSLVRVSGPTGQTLISIPADNGPATTLVSDATSIRTRAAAEGTVLAINGTQARVAFLDSVGTLTTVASPNPTESIRGLITDPASNRSLAIVTDPAGTERALVQDRLGPVAQVTLPGGANLLETAAFDPSGAIFLGSRPALGTAADTVIAVSPAGAVTTIPTTLSPTVFF